MKIRYWLYKLIRTKSQAEADKLPVYLTRLFEPAGIDLHEYRFYNKKLSVKQVDEVLHPLDKEVPEVNLFNKSLGEQEDQFRLRAQVLYENAMIRMTRKNMLLDCGLMDAGIVGTRPRKVSFASLLRSLVVKGIS